MLETPFWAISKFCQSTSVLHLMTPKPVVRCGARGVADVSESPLPLQSSWLSLATPGAAKKGQRAPASGGSVDRRQPFLTHGPAPAFSPAPSWTSSGRSSRTCWRHLPRCCP